MRSGRSPAGFVAYRNQIIDFKGAALIFDVIREAKSWLGDKEYDAEWVRNALLERGIRPRVPP